MVFDRPIPKNLAPIPFTGSEAEAPLLFLATNAISEINSSLKDKTSAAIPDKTETAVKAIKTNEGSNKRDKERKAKDKTKEPKPRKPRAPKA